MKQGCGFPSRPNGCLHSLFPPSPAVFIRGSESPGDQPAGPEIPWGHAMLPPGTVAQSVLAFGTRSWNVCIRKQLGWRGTLRTPPEFLRPVTFSSGFPKMIPRAWGS